MSTQDFSIGFGQFGPNVRGPITAGDVRLVENENGVVTVMPADQAPPAPALARPSLPVLTPSPRGFVIAWNGLDETGAPYPAYFRFVEVHVSDSSQFEISAQTLRSTFASRSGGEFTFTAGMEYLLGLAPEYTVRLAARNTQDVLGPATEGVTVSTGRVEPIDIADLSLTVTKFKTNQHLLY